MFAYPLYEAPGTLMQMLQSRKTRLDDSDRPVHCRFFKKEELDFLASNGWYFASSQWWTQDMYIKQAFYPIHVFRMWMSDDKYELVAEALIETDFIHTVRGDLSFADAVVEVHGDDPIQLHRELMAKSAEYLRKYNEWALQEILTEREPAKESAASGC